MTIHKTKLSGFGKFLPEIWAVLSLIFIFWVVSDFFRIIDSGFFDAYLSPILWVGPISYFAYVVFLVTYVTVGRIKTKYLLQYELRKYKCLPLEKENSSIFNYIKKISEENSIRTPLVYISHSIINNAFSLDDGKTGVIILSKEILEKLTASQIEAVLRHELYHLKYFTTNKLYHLTTFFSTKRNIMYVCFLPLFLISAVHDFFIYRYLWYDLGLVFSILNFRFLLYSLILVSCYLGYAAFSLSRSERSPFIHPTYLSELLSDAFSVLYDKDFENMRNVITSLEREDRPSYHLDFQECFIFKNKNRKLKRDKKRIASPNPLADHQDENNWVDIVYDSKIKSPIRYDYGTRIQFLEDLQLMCNDYVEIKIIRKKTALFRGEYRTISGTVEYLDLWNLIFKKHGLSKELLGSVFSYIKEHEKKFNLVECSKAVGQSEFITLLAILRHIFHKNFGLKWRPPTASKLNK